MNEATSRSLGAGARVIALDIGVSSVKFALIDESGQLGGTGVEELVLNQQRLAASQLAQLIRTQFDGGPPAAVGVTAPGIVDASTGVVRHSANLDWQNFALGDELSELLDIPVVVSHDAYSAGVAEHHLGAARGVQNAIITVLGTGISSALWWMVRSLPRVVMRAKWAMAASHRWVAPRRLTVVAVLLVVYRHSHPQVG